MCFTSTSKPCIHGNGKDRVSQIKVTDSERAARGTVLEHGFYGMNRTFITGNNISLVLVSCAIRFLFAYPMPLKSILGVARILLDPCLIRGLPVAIRSEVRAGGGTHLCRWLHVGFIYGSADRPREQGASFEMANTCS